jgi:hypothetical protein
MRKGFIILGLSFALIGLVIWVGQPPPETSDNKAPRRDIRNTGSGGKADLSRGQSEPIVNRHFNWQRRDEITNFATWSERRDQILKMAVADETKVWMLFDTLPELRAEDLEEAAKHLVNLANNEQFEAAAAYLVDTGVPLPVQRILFGELLNRPETIKLPTSLAIARNPEHPLADEARRVLAVCLPEDYGTNWGAWESAVQARLEEIRKK